MLQLDPDTDILLLYSIECLLVLVHSTLNGTRQRGSRGGE